MVDISKIKEYYKSGRGTTFQYYITDQELQSILLEKLSKEYEPYSLICYKNDGNGLFFFQEEMIGNFNEARAKNYDTFFLRSLKITPDIIIPFEPVVSAERRSELQSYYIYNGLIEIQHGFKLKHKYFYESSIGVIGKYYNINSPDKLFENEDYTKVFNVLKKNIKHVLKYRSKEILASGRVSVSKVNNVSQGFAEGIKAGTLISYIEIE